MTSATKKAASWEAKGNKWGAQAVQQGVDARVAAQQPFIQAGTKAFGLVGTPPLETTQTVSDAQQQGLAQRQQAINAGVNPNLSPLQQQAMQNYLGQNVNYGMGDYQQQVANLRQQADMQNKGYQSLQNLGLGGVSAATGASLGGAQYLGQSQMNTRDAYTQANLMNQQTKAQQTSGLLGLAGVIGGGVLGSDAFKEWWNQPPKKKSDAP